MNLNIEHILRVVYYRNISKVNFMKVISVFKRL